MLATDKVGSIVTADNRLCSPVTLQADSKGYHPSFYTLNRQKTVAPFHSRESRLKHLQLHGLEVPADQSSKQVIRQYLVGVFQCRTLFTYVSNDKTYWLAGYKLQTPERFTRLKAGQINREARRVERLSVRAVYALGWDYGVVRLGKALKGKVVVLDVIHNPKLSGYMIEAFKQAFEAYKKRLPVMVSDSAKLLLGTDPEFILTDQNGALKYASDYFTRHGLVGCDAILQGNNRAHKPIVEIRPKAARSPRELVLRLYRGMLMAAKKINDPNIRWLAGALPFPGFPIGGHIHFSGVPLSAQFLRALDNYIVLPLVLVEDKRGIKRRPTYGFLGDFREQFHGGFEYRTPPSWLISPTLTKGIFSLARVVALHYPYFNEWPLTDLSLQKAYYDGDKEEIKRVVPTLWDELSRFPTYREEAVNLDNYYRMLMSGKTWDESEDIRVKWRIPPFHNKNKR